MVTIEEYRKILNDYKSSEEQIEAKINFITKICQNIIRDEINAYARKK